MFLPYFIYLAVVVFILGNLYRAIRIASMPVHVRWELYPVPHEPVSKFEHGGSYMEDSNWWEKRRHTNKLGELGVMLPEIFLLAGVCEANRTLWIWSLLFHWGLYLSIGVAGFAVTDTVLTSGGLTAAVPIISKIGINLQGLTVVTAWMAGISGLIGTAGVFFVRLLSPKLKNFNSFATLFNLILLICLFATGIAVCFSGLEGYHQIQEFLRTLVKFETPDPLPGLITAHFAIFSFFLLYFPFTHMTHMFLKYFTYHSVRWDDKPLGKGSHKEHRVEAALQYPVSWSAPHIKGDGKKTWIQVVSEDGSKHD